MDAGGMRFLVPGGCDWVDVRDVVEAAWNARLKGRRGERYVLSGHWSSMRDLAATVDRVSGIQRRRIVVPLWLAGAGIRLCRLLLRAIRRSTSYSAEALQILQGPRLISHDKATRELAHAPRPLEHTVRDTIQWYRSRPE
jgi:dihydroflavonol-4-reductase